MKQDQLEFYYPSVSNGITTRTGITLEEGKILNITAYLVNNPATTLYAKVKDDSYSGYGIAGGDLLIVDCSIDHISSNLCVISLKEEVFIKRIKAFHGKLFMISEYSYIKPIEIIPELQVEIHGVITHIIHKPD